MKCVIEELKSISTVHLCISFISWLCSCVQDFALLRKDPWCNILKSTRGDMEFKSLCHMCHQFWHVCLMVVWVAVSSLL